MPDVNVHCAISRIRTGKTYRGLHKFLDKDEKNMGKNHRRKNHFYDDELRKCIEEQFGGPEAVSEWLFHLVVDNLGTYYKNQAIHKLGKKNFLKIGFLRNGYINCSEAELSNSQMLFEFKKQ
ncbi:hypothetical protein JXA85_00595 [Candidatus Woesearchaeota archaeon]|nr:hypothetical protein [Candidatus Woesearchaeota archaeon]